MKKKIIQPEINIGMVGHVDHGKTALVFALTGKQTDTHSEEIKRGITIRLGYADASFYKCNKCNEYTNKEKCKCGENAEFLRKVSFIDAPGHETLMATMLSGAAIIDGAILLVAANEKCPQPQTREHIMALEMIGIKNIVIVQNKIDLVNEKEVLENYKEIKEFVKGTIAENAPVIPISAQHSVNINAVIEAIEENIKTPERDLDKDPIMFIARSFDINKPGSEIEELKGGVIGGALKQGMLKVEEEVEIKPGLSFEKAGKIIWKPIITKIISLKTGGDDVNEVQPGGSIGVLTKLDPFLVKADKLTGNMLGKPGKLPEVFGEFDLKIKLLERVVGAKQELKVEPIKRLEALMLNVNSAVTVGVVSELKKNIVHVKLKIPVCADKKDKLTVSRRIGDRFRLIGIAEICS